ncbi:uncharacterized protein LOC131598392 [Vicia villosa]|uniref:uncharacterized protein LOC131598392 n=1 Tax=Vicia villosa TaxID=3911 RepID=UPI00273CBD53|nr:uncharacterized protein LOC131598392 [Vicia villosa]
MERYFKRKFTSESQENVESRKLSTPLRSIIGGEKRFLEVDLNNLPADPGERKQISCYHPNDRDNIRRAYLQKGPCQPRDHDFPKRKIGPLFRKFNPNWFLEFGNWLEYSVSKDAVFCLCCYLMRSDIGEQKSSDAFSIDGFSNWKKKERLDIHVGNFNSAHNQAWRSCEALMNQKQHIEVAISKQSDLMKREYRIHLTSVIDCIRYLLKQGLAFRGHDESINSKNKGNFLELIHLVSIHDKEFDMILKNARGNLKLMSPSIQKDIVTAAACETTKVIVDSVRDDFFSILIDESRDTSTKEQMSVVLRYVDKKGSVIERFLGLVHVANTSAISLKLALESLFATHNLSLSRVRGQGYDGASNMQGEFNGLKSLILKENSSAFYVHCFAHQLQLALVAVAKKQVDVGCFFSLVNNVSNIVGGSCKRQEILRESQMLKVQEALLNGEISSGSGFNQEATLKRAGDTRWGSHYGTLLSLISLFTSVIDVLEFVEENGSSSDQQIEACHLLKSIQSFEFIFNLHLMKNIFGITNDLSQALQRSDQDIVNAISLVRVCKGRLQGMRDNGWHTLLNEVSLFCEKQNISIPNMDDALITQGRSKRKAQKISNLHRFQVELFYEVIDRQLQELNNRFNEVNTELLLCVASLNPRDSFFTFDKEKLIHLAKFYPSEFSHVELIVLDSQLETFIIDLRSDDKFSKLNGITELSEMLVKTKKHIVYPMIFLLVRLALILPVATATVERSFSAMNFVKNGLRNRMGDEWLNDCLVTYIESDIFDEVDNGQ